MLSIQIFLDISFFMSELLYFQRLLSLSKGDASDFSSLSQSVRYSIKWTGKCSSLLCIWSLCHLALVATVRQHKGTSRWHLSLLFPFLFFCYLLLFQGKLTPFLLPPVFFCLNYRGPLGIGGCSFFPPVDFHFSKLFTVFFFDLTEICS